MIGEALVSWWWIMGGILAMVGAVGFSKGLGTKVNAWLQRRR